MSAVLQRICDPSACHAQLWEEMTPGERGAFASEPVLNQYCQQQGRLFGTTAWMEASVHPCTCDRGKTAAPHGAVYNLRGPNPSWARIPPEEQASIRATFDALETATDGEVCLSGHVLTVVIVAMHAMMRLRPGASHGDGMNRRAYVKYFEARSIPRLGPDGPHRPDIHALARIPIHSHGDKWAIVLVHLRHVEDCEAVVAREKYYDELGGEQCARFLRFKERQQLDKNRRKRSSEEEGQGGGATRVAAASYQSLAIYEIMSIKRVFGGMNTAVPHANPLPGSDGESGEEAEAIGGW